MRALAALSVLPLLGCYHNRPWQTPARQYRSDSGATLAVVESDDEGNFWNSAQADAALQLVRAHAGRVPTAVLVFVPGWGHNAQSKDQNLVCFSRTLDYLSQRLNGGPVRMLERARVSAALRAPTSGVLARPADDSVRVIGIYAGWRGRSLPEAPSVLSVVTRVPTFWGRKRTADIVGQGDLRGFIGALSAIYDSVNYAPGSSGERPFFSLVSIGHSFGGQALLPAVSARLEEQLHEAAGDDAWKALRGEDIHPTRPVSIRGMGDLVILVNPAVEAARYEPLHRLSRQLRYHTDQTPALVVFSADNDVPRHFLFPLGRFFSTLFKARAEQGSWERDQVVLGRHDPQVTHRIALAPTSVPAVGLLADSGPGKGSNPFELHAADCSYRGSVDHGGQDELAAAIARHDTSADASGDLLINGKQLKRVSASPQPHAALMVVRTSSHQVLNNHNGFFKPEFVDFLVRYVTDIEAMRFEARLAR
jgi:hypothetical protein